MEPDVLAKNEANVPEGQGETGAPGEGGGTAAERKEKASPAEPPAVAEQAVEMGDGEGGIVLMDMVGESEIQEPEAAEAPAALSEEEARAPGAPEPEGRDRDGVRWTDIATGQDIEVPEDLKKSTEHQASDEEGRVPDRIGVLEEKMDRLLEEF
ncbi:MAG: hypothetical protein AB1921_18160, partial [Thermodesulfobacteriota bacterium]